MIVPVDFAKLTSEQAAYAKGCESGHASSAVTLAFGCGHWFQRVNGDSLYHTCPLCFLNRLASTR